MSAFPRLPQAQQDYDPRIMDALYRVLALWGQRVDSDNRFLAETLVSARATTATTVTVVTTDYLLLVNTTAGNTAVALPAAALVLNRTFMVKRTSAGANTLTVTPTAGTIDGAANSTLVAQYACREYKSDGTNYWITAYYLA